MIYQGVAMANVDLHQNKFSKQVYFTTEEVIGVKVDYSWDGIPFFFFTSALASGLYSISERMMDFSYRKRGQYAVNIA